WYYWTHQCDGRAAQTLPDHEAEVWAVAFDGTGDVVSATGEWQQKLVVKRWDPGTGTLRPAPTPDLPTEQLHVYALSLSPDGKWLAAATLDESNRKSPVGQARGWDGSAGGGG